MASFTGVVESAHAPDETFAYLAAFEHTSEWDPGCPRAQRSTDGELGVGSRFRLGFTLAGSLQMTLVYEIVRFEPTTEVQLQGGNWLFDSTDTITVDPTDHGSRVTYNAVVSLKGPGALLDPVLAGGFGRVGERARDGLAQRLSRPL